MLVDPQRDKSRAAVLSVRHAVLVLGTITCTAAHATERAEVVLDYARHGAAQKSCPDQATFRGLVAARLGYDPFAKESVLALRVEFRPRGRTIDGSLKLTSSGAPKGGRTMSADQKDCYELAASLALAAAVAVDPEREQAQHVEPETKASDDGQRPLSEPVPPATPSAPPAQAAPPLPTQTAPPPNPPVAPPPRAHTVSRILFDLGPVLSLGTQPNPAVGLRLGGSVRVGPWSVGAEASAFLPTERSAPYGTVSAHGLYGSLVPCAHPGGARFTLDVCAVLSLGALFSDATGVGQSRAVTDRYTTLGPRLGFTFMASDALGFAVNAEAPVNLSRVHLFIDDGGASREVWAASRLGFIGGASLVLELQ